MEIQEKQINLVFDVWDGENDLPNSCKNFPNYPFFNARYFFETHFCNVEHRNPNDGRRIKIKKYSLSEINKNRNVKYFYIVSSPLLEFQNLLDKNLEYENYKSFFSEDVLNMFRENSNFYLVFTKEHESVSDFEVQSFKNYCVNNNLDTNRIFYLNNNSLSQELSKNYNVNVHKLNFIEYSSTKSLTNIMDVSFLPEKTGKFFMCRNNNPKIHRLNLILQLQIKNIIDNVNYSLLQPTTDGDNESFQFSLSEDEIHKYKDLIKKFTITKEDDIEAELNYYDRKNKQWNHPLINRMQYPEIKEIYENTYVNIVTESNYFDNSIVHITEKTYRPFYYYQIPIILSSTHHIKKLKEKYDFDFFNEIVDHSYDSELDNKKRFFMVVNEIKRLNENQNQIKEFYKKNQHRFELNRKKLLDIALDKTEDFDFFWNLI